MAILLFYLLLVGPFIAHATFSYVRREKFPAQGPFHTAWRPLESVTVTVSIYVISSILATFALYELFGGAILRELATQNSTVVNFIYLLIFESFTILLLIAFLNRRKARLRSLGFRWPHWDDVAYVALSFSLYFIILVIAEKTLPFIDFDQKQDIGFSTNVGGMGLVIVFVSLVLLVPFVEEVVTRGFLYSGLRSKITIVPAALITSVLFGLAHLQPGSGNPLLWAAAVDTFVLSVLLVALRETTKSLTAPIMLHMLKNGIAFTYLFVIPRLT